MRAYSNYISDFFFCMLFTKRDALASGKDLLGSLKSPSSLTVAQYLHLHC